VQHVGGRVSVHLKVQRATISHHVGQVDAFVDPKKRSDYDESERRDNCVVPRQTESLQEGVPAGTFFL
jgi:hypothetical protein